MAPEGTPEDFAEFWQETVQFARVAPLDFERRPVAERLSDTHHVVEIRFRGIDGGTRYGWIAYEPGAHRQAAFLWIPPYGRESKLPDAYGTRPGFTSLSFNFFGESAFHQEKYVTARGYFSDGAESPETWIFRRMFQDTVLATRILQALPEADEDRLSVMGMSQGGGISTWNAAWNPRIRAAVADMPFLATITNTLTNTVYRYPLKELADAMETLPLGRERILNTVSYFDTALHAAYAKVPLQISFGLKDPACRPATVQAVFDAAPEPKRLVTYDWGHDWHPDMVETNAAWLREHLG
jgi:cephalosporin-C deacetylase